jgi:hypothetical protein
MSSKWRRFEVLLPLQFNDGKDVPPEWLAEAVLEIVDHFGAASYETQKLEGHWRHGGVLYRDNLVRVVVDVPDSANSRRWMKQFKGRWILAGQLGNLRLPGPGKDGVISYARMRPLSHILCCGVWSASSRHGQHAEARATPERLERAKRFRRERKN